MINFPLVSVGVITYNQDQFIENTILSILSQSADFKFELVISDDNSNDKTKEIILNLIKNHPEGSLIKFINLNENIGAVKNLSKVLRNCSGRYIALCEGDDYWNDPLKIKKQIQFLEANPDFSLCFHNCLILENGTLRKSDILSKRFNDSIKEFGLEDLADGNFIHTPSVIFRNFEDIIENKIFDLSPVGDMPLFSLLALKGRIGLIDGYMAVYRSHEGGMWSNIDTNIRRLKIIEYLKILFIHFPHPYRKVFKKRLLNEYYKLAKIEFNNKRYFNAFLKSIELLRIYIS